MNPDVQNQPNNDTQSPVTDAMPPSALEATVPSVASAEPAVTPPVAPSETPAPVVETPAGIDQQVATSAPISTAPAAKKGGNIGLVLLIIVLLVVVTAAAMLFI